MREQKLVPTWPEASKETEAEALGVFRRLLPGWEVVGLDSQGLRRQEGALHCMTMNAHRLNAEE